MIFSTLYQPLYLDFLVLFCDRLLSSNELRYFRNLLVSAFSRLLRRSAMLRLRSVLSNLVDLLFGDSFDRFSWLLSVNTLFFPETPESEVFSFSLGDIFGEMCFFGSEFYCNFVCGLLKGELLEEDGWLGDFDY